MAAQSYEAARNERLEENKRRMEELGLLDLAKEIKKPKIQRPPVVRKAKVETEPQEARRSSRVAAKPVVVYRELPRKPAVGKSRSRRLMSEDARERRARQGLRRRYLTEVARKIAIEAAEGAVKDIKNPAFVKPLQHSRISAVCWVALPEAFCKEHLPTTDAQVVLEDGKGKEWECLYIATKYGMSSGWRGFVVDHDLMDGDCCIFELVRPVRFKVHIVRFLDDGDESEEEEEDDDEEDDEEDEDSEEDDSDDSDDERDRKKSRPKKARRSFSAKKREVGEDDEDEEDEVDEEEEDEEEEFDSDVCDDHESEEEADEDDSEDDYSPRLSDKVVDTLVAAPSRASRGLQRKTVKEEDEDVELGHGETSNGSPKVEEEIELAQETTFSSQGPHLADGMKL